MKSTSETGHTKNVANFQDLIEFVTGYGTTYNPSKETLKLSQIITLKSNAENALADVITRNTAYNNKINERVSSFSGLKSLSTRLINALQTTDATEETINDAKSYNRKLQGKKVSDSQPPTDSNVTAPNTISSSQQSYDQLIQHFIGLKSVLDAEPTYTPNETDLQITSIDAKIADLTAKNTAVATAYANVSNSRISRNKILYTNTASLVETANEVKKYIKSVFGATSPEYAQVKGIEFTKSKI